MADPSASIVRDPVRMMDIWSDRSCLDQGLPYPPEMAAAPTSTPVNTRRKSRRSWFEKTPATNFEIKVESPKQKQKPVPKQRRESEEPEILTLTHFTAPPRIGYGKMKPGEIKERTLLLRNPHDYEQTVRVEKVPEKKFFSVDSRCIVVPSGETCPLTITWAPKDEGNFREMILMQVDKAYRLQAYVFGSVAEPPKKKKARKGGLLSTKVSRPFSVIHTTSLANIDRSYSPEKTTLSQKKMEKKPTGPSKVIKRNSTENRRHSQRLSGNKLVLENIEIVKHESNTRTEQERVSVEKQGPKKLLPRGKKDEHIPKKKMRRSNTYSNVSGIGLPIPIIHGETIQGHMSIEGQLSVIKDNSNISGFEVKEAQNFNCDRKEIVSSLPSFLEADDKTVATKTCDKSDKENSHSFVEVDSLDNCKETELEKNSLSSDRKSDLEHSFIEIESDICKANNGLRETYHLNEKNALLSKKPTTNASNNSELLIENTVKDPVLVECIQIETCQIMNNPVLNHLKTEESFKDSLNQTPDLTEPPSFLSPDSFVENAMKYKLRRSARKVNPNDEVESPTSSVNLKSHLNVSRPIVSPDTFVREMSSVKKTVSTNKLTELEIDRQKPPSPETVLNDSIPHNVIIQQLESVKANLHDQNFVNGKPVKGKFDSCSTKNNNKKLAVNTEADILDRRETFIKKRSSPRLSVPSSEMDFRRGTFVVEAKKAKVLECQQPSEASPRRTTFTVIKKATIDASKLRARARSDETPRNLRRRARSQNKASTKEANEKTAEECSNEKNKSISIANTCTDERKMIVAEEKPVKTKSDTVNKEKRVEIKKINSEEECDSEFKSAGEISQEHTDEATRRCTLTVTKSRPSDALLNHVKNTEGISVNLFPASHNNSSDKSRRQLDSFNENEEDSLDTSQKLSKNSTFEVSANKSIILNKSGIQSDSFPTTPGELPLSPNPDHSRRSTHVVEKPKVLDLSRTNRKQLFPGIVDYEEDTEDNTASPKESNDKNVSITFDYNKIKTGCPSSNTRSTAAGKSLNVIAEQTEKIDRINSKIETQSCQNLDFSDASRANGSGSVVSMTEVKKEINDKKMSDSNRVGEVYFVPVDNKQMKEVAKPVMTGPHSFLKKRSNAVVQNEDRIQSKRVRSDSDDAVKGKVLRVEKPKLINARVTRSRNTGMASEKLERQVLKPKAPMKGVAQSKLILMKKTKSALPKHPLPFAAKNMYYDERWMEKQERGFVNWLNFILTPAEEYQSNEVKVKVDAGKLTIDVAKGNTKLAPTNEVLSFRAYAAHRKLNRLRKSACRLFQSEDVIRVIQKLEAEVESKRLRVRKDKMMHADLGVKQKILDMLLSYNTLWLRIGLETIYGEVLPLQSNSDVFGLSRFLLTRLLNSPDIVEEYAHPTVPHLYKDGYAEVVAQHTLKKFMMLVYFLDKAKQSRLIEHNPCLFCKDSDFKASKDLLHQFSRDYLSGEGDITRHLGYLGYKVTYTQTALDEFDFAVSKLSTDLRDGLRLTRVMEFLSNKPDLSKTLRVPAISRLQKIHNVEVIFKTLEEQGLQSGKVTPRDIVDGHREKTLQLLWTIILHYQVELLLNEEQLKEEINILQKSLKVKSQLQNLFCYDQKPRRESAEPDLHTQNPRLNLLLKWCRTVCAFYSIKIENFTVSFSDGRALCHIIHHYHPGLLPAEAIQSETTLTHLDDMQKKTQQNLATSFNDSCNSSAAFGDIEDPEIFDGLLNNEKENFRVLFEKVKELGGIPLMLKWSDMSNTIPDEKVVVTYLLYLCARLLDIRHESRAARVIQLAWRKHRLRKMEKELKKKNGAASVIQAAIRKYLASRRLGRQEASAVCIQRVWRGHQGRQLARKLRQEKVLEEQRQAVMILQRAVKQYIHRRQFLQMKHSIVQLQAHCRNYLLRKKMSSAAVTIQKWVRGHQIRKQLQQKKNSVMIIQAQIRGCLVRSHLRKLCHAAYVIQAAYRAHRARNIQHLKFCEMKKACVSIQRRFREYLKMKEYRKIHSAVKIQSCYRGHIARRDYLKVKAAAVCIQATCRTHLQRKKFLETKKAVILLQSHIHGYIVAKKQREHYQSLRKAAILIQARWRMVREKRNFMHARKSVTKLQASVRMILDRKHFMRLKNVVTDCQRRYRAKVSATAGRREFLVKKGAAITIQACFRGHMVRKDLHRMTSAAIVVQSVFKGYLQMKHYSNLKKAVAVIQESWRAKVLGQRERQNFLDMRNAAITIQAVFRGQGIRKQFQMTRRKIILVQAYVKGHQQRHSYEKLKQASVLIQRKWRAELIARQHVESFQQTKAAVLLLQSYVRMYQQRRNYHSIKKSVVLLQSCVRMHIEKENLKKIKNATLILQRRFRASLEGQKCRRQYLVSVGAIITIQSAYRGYCVRKQMENKRKAAIIIQSNIRRFLQRRKFMKLKRAAVISQRQYRAKSEGQKCRRQYLVSLGAIVTIQAAYRGYCVRKDFEKKAKAAVVVQSNVRRFILRGKFVRLKKAVIICQRHFRAKLAGNIQRCEFLRKKSAAVKIQSLCRRYICRYSYLNDRCQIIKLQACVRRHQIQKRFLKTKTAVLVIQNRWRETLVARQQIHKYQTLRQSAVFIQAIWKMKLEKRKYDHLKRSVVRIQSFIRMIQQCKQFRSLKSATETIQKYYRAKLLADHCRREFLISKGAAITIQALYRGHLVRKDLKYKNKAATIIQSYIKGQHQRSDYLKVREMATFCQRQFRAKLIRRKVQGEYERLKKGVTLLQAIVRGRAERLKYLKLRNMAIVVQSHFRGSKTRSDLKRLRQAVVVIQTRYRADIVARQQRQEYLKMQKAAIMIQSCLRMTKTRCRYIKMVRSVVKLQALFSMVCTRNKYLCMKECAVKIQKWFRGALETKRLEYEFLVTRGAAITIQAAIRGFLARKRYRQISAARKIQAAYRCHIESKKYQSTRKSVILVQSVVRGYLARKYLEQIKCRCRAAVLIQQTWCAWRESRIKRCEYLRLKSAALVCQSAYRAKLAMLNAQKDFLEQKRAVIIIQSAFRGHIVRKRIKIQNSAAVRIQSTFRCYKERKQYLELKRSAIICQKRFSAKHLGRKQRIYFLSLRKAVVWLQSVRKAAVCRQKFLQMRNAAIKIQSCYRGFLQRKTIAQENQAAMVLQRRWQAELLCRQRRNEYQCLRDAAVVIQSVFRGRKVRCLFSQIRAAVKLQAYLKMTLVRKKYRQLLAASVKIQAHFKMWKARKEFLAVREQRRKEREAHLHRVSVVAKVNMAAIRIQHCYRNYVVTKRAKERLHSVILLQRWMRAKLTRMHYLKTRERLCRLQVAIRDWLSRRHSAAEVIQRTARKWLASKHVRQQDKAAVKIQALWKGYSLRRKSKSKRLTLVRQRVEEANAAATEEKKLGNRTSSALDYLLKYKHLSPVLDALKHLGENQQSVSSLFNDHLNNHLIWCNCLSLQEYDVATRLSPVCCEKMVEVNALGVLYRLVNSCNRSLPHMEIIKYTVNILLNLAKYEKTRHAVYSEEDGIHTIVELMQIYREKKGPIFINACTLLGILALDSTCKMSLMADKKLVERLQSIQTLTARKHKLEENQRLTRARMNATINSTFVVRSPVKRHKIKPDWSLHRDKLSDFDNPLKAINFVLGNLGISVK